MNAKRCAKQKKPDLNKSFFENYKAHIRIIEEKYTPKFSGLVNPNTGKMNETLLDAILDDVSDQLTIFDAVHDGYDYLDEVMSATILPFVAATVAIVSLHRAVKESINIFISVVQKGQTDKSHHIERTKNWLNVMIIAATFGLGSFIKSIISLITRPVVTAIRGFKSQDVARFNNDTGYESGVKSFVNSLFRK